VQLIDEYIPKKDVISFGKEVHCTGSTRHDYVRMINNRRPKTPQSKNQLLKQTHEQPPNTV
jgi:hypothetical protein